MWRTRLMRLGSMLRAVSSETYVFCASLVYLFLHALSGYEAIANGYRQIRHILVTASSAGTRSPSHNSSRLHRGGNQAADTSARRRPAWEALCLLFSQTH